MTTVLLIDDHPAILDDYSQILAFEGFDVLQADNGLLGVHYAQQYTPDVIICDMQMPGINGEEVRQLLLSNETTANIPFAFLSAGMSDAITGVTRLVKPIPGDKLVNAIRKLINCNSRL